VEDAIGIDDEGAVAVGVKAEVNTALLRRGLAAVVINT
jgi:hypothetical protein